MKFYSTNHQSPEADLKEAVLQSMPADKGLYMPQAIKPLPQKFFDNIENLSFAEIAFEVAKNILDGSIPENDLKEIVEDAINFPAPLIPLTYKAPSDILDGRQNQNINRSLSKSINKDLNFDFNKAGDVSEDALNILELFHGPTLAFKDFGARFMARAVRYLTKELDQKITVLVATSGDTGSAVASGFYKVPGIEVVLLYPSGKVSKIQEQQLTTMGENIIALEVDGVFDDCQSMVKQAFTDPELREKMKLTSANSINIARLIPQSFYYFEAYKQLKDKSKPLVFSVPSGNFGNLTAGLMAKKMGLPIHSFVAATNINNTIPRYLESGEFDPKPSQKTISNAMDVGNPNNFPRILDLHNNDFEKVKENLWGTYFGDEETKMAIKEVYEKYSYVIDPHGAVGYLGLKKYQEEVNSDINGVILETAHPAKFSEEVEKETGQKVEIPDRLKECMTKSKNSAKMINQFSEFKEFLLRS